MIQSLESNFSNKIKSLVIKFRVMYLWSHLNFSAKLLYFNKLKFLTL